MSNEPLNTGGVKLYLDFVNDGSDPIQIEEPTGFDALNFNLKQESKRYGRDVVFGDTELTFYKNINPVAFDRLIEINNIDGFESEVLFIIQVDGVDFTHGELEFSKAVTDSITYFTVEVLQNSNEAKIKRKKSIKVDLFSSQDLEENPIDPVQTHSILLKAKPAIQTSKWLKTDFWIYTGQTFIPNYFHQNPIQQLSEDSIQDSLTWLSSFSEADNTSIDDFDNFKIIAAQSDLTDNVMSFTDIAIKFSIPTGQPFEQAGSWVDFNYPKIVFKGHIGETAVQDFNVLLDLDFNYEFVRTYQIGDEYFPLPVSITPTDEYDEYLVTIPNQEFTLPTIARDTGFWGLFSLGRIQTVTDWVSGEVSISSTATGIDSVITGVRLIDAQKQVIKSINGNPVNAPDFDVGGEHYGNFIFNGKLIRQITDEPFNIAFKDIEEHLQELNYDYQSNETEVDILYYGDYYKNEEITAFGGIPFKDFEIIYNERYLINQFDYKYKSFEQDKDETNTRDAVHTETQYLIPNNKTENTKPIDVPFTRDPFRIKFLQERNVQSDGTTSLNGDDDTFILDCIELSPDTTRTITASMTHNLDNGNVQLLNDGSFNWGLLGFNVGDSFTIDASQNVGLYTVETITFNIITLTPVGVPNFNGQSLTTVTYPITNVLYTNRTNEGFSNIEGVQNPDNYSNLNYTIRRNLELWKPYISTAMRYNQKNVVNTLFINDPELVTTKTGEQPIIEVSGIEKQDLNNAILSPHILNPTITGVDFYTHSNLINSIRSGKGFVRVADTANRMLKVHIKDSSYSWKYNTLDIEAEVRLENEFVTIDKIGNIIKVDETGYDPSRVYPFDYVTNGNFIQVFDNNSVPLINKTRYDFVKINNITYNSIDELAIAISEL